MGGGSGNKIVDEGSHVGEGLETRHGGDDPLRRLRGDRPRRRRAVAAEFLELGDACHRPRGMSVHHIDPLGVAPPVA